VIALHQAGFANVVSPMGTALTEQQLFQLKRYSRRIVLALDPDAAGDKATLRGLQIARQTLDREADPVFDARGLLGYEARLRADIRVSTLPDGLDPDEVVNRDPGEWERIVSQASPIVVHVMETLAASRDLDDPKTKNEIAAQVLPLIEDVPSPIERDTYRQRLARLLRVDERALLGAGTGARSRPRRPSSAQTAQTAEQSAAPLGMAQIATSNYALEVHCLGILLRRPDLLYRVDRGLRQKDLEPLSPADFQHADHQAIVDLFQQAVDQDSAEPLNYVLNSLDLPMMELADGLLARTSELDPDDERVLEDLMRGVVDLRLRNWRQKVEYLRYVMKDAQDQGDVKASQYGQTMVQLNEEKLRLDRALEEYTGRSAVKRRT
jgi:DNA primase